MKIDLSLIIPCYNEEEHLRESYRKIVWILDRLKLNWEVLLIDDGSTDNTREIIKEIARGNYRLTAIFHQKNVGRGGTVAEGINSARGKIVGFLDIDLEVSEQYLPSFIWKIEEGFDVAIAKRNYEFTLAKLPRFIASRGYAFLASRVLNSPFNDTEAGYKFFNREKILPILKKCSDDHWFWDTEICLQSYKAGLKICEIPVVFIRNFKKKSTVKLIPDTLTYLKKMIAYKKKNRNK